MADVELRWVTVATFGNGLEAEIAVTRLAAAGLDAVVRGAGVVGVFGAGFQGSHPSGWRVMVPNVVLDEARAVLAGEAAPDDAVAPDDATAEHDADDFTSDDHDA